MATFDFIEAAAQGYRLTFEKRNVIWRMMMPVFIVKLLSFILIVLMGYEENFLRQGLVLLPSFFIEGLVLCRLIRLIFHQPATQNALYAGTAIYVLIKLITALFAGLLLDGNVKVGADYQPPDPSLMTFLAALLLLALIFWSFRLLWLYIPAAMGYSIWGFLKTIQGYMISFTMMGSWLICFMPFALAMGALSEILLSVFPPLGGANSTAYKYAALSVQAVTEVLIAVVTTLGLTSGIKVLLTGSNSKGSPSS